MCEYKYIINKIYIRYHIIIKIKRRRFTLCKKEKEIVLMLDTSSAVIKVVLFLGSNK